MKKFNYKLHTTFLFTILMLQGCMPDSLTKFKKDAPKKASTAAVTNASGTVVDTKSINPPTTFYYPNNNDLVLEVGKSYDLGITGDNDFSTEASMNNILLGCSISPAFPAGYGVKFDTKTCKIVGTPSQVLTNTNYINTKGKLDFTVTVTFAIGPDATSSLSRAIKFQILQAPKSLLYSEAPNVKLEIQGDVSSFSDNNGKIISDDGKVTSDLTKNAVKGVVKTVDSTKNILGVTISTYFDNAYPSGNSYVDTTPVNSSPDTKADNPHYYFLPGDKIDSDDTFFQNRGTILDVRNVFQTTTSAPTNCSPNDGTDTTNCSALQPLTYVENGINLTDTSAQRNYMEFTVTPKLPIDIVNNKYYFNINKYTGKITGWSTVPIALNTYKVTASNVLGSVSTTVKFSVVEAPTHFSYSTRQLLTLSALAFSYVREGDTIIAPITLPKTLSVKGLITKTISATNQVEILVTNGLFTKDTPIDIGPTYNAAVGSVLTDPLNFSVALNMTAAVTVPAGGAVVGDIYVQNPTAASVTTSRLYALMTNNSVVSNGTSILGSTVSEIDSTSLKIKLTAAPPANMTGLDITSSDAMASGYVYDQSGANVFVSNLYRSVNTADAGSRFFKANDTVYFNERVGVGTSGAITNSGSGDVSYDNYYAAERNNYLEIQPNLKAGTGLTFTVTPSLPRGLTLDSTTGLISGTPTEATSLNAYTIVAKNLINSSSIVIKLEVRDYFTLAEKSGAPSYKLHKVGDYQNATGCRINSSDIYNARGNLDIRCEMDGEEEDIHFFGLNLQSTVGPGVCQYVQITPYHFWKWAPKQTNATVVRWDNANTTTVSDRAITSELDCDGNYTLEGGPNCDEGTITINNYKYDTKANPQETFVSTETIKCGGKKANCIDGPLTDLLTTDQIQSGMRGLIYSSSSGIDKTWNFSTPISKSDLTNIRIANNAYVYSNAAPGSKCGDSKTEVDNWSSLNYTGSIPLTTILNTNALYTPGTDTNFYSTSQYLINGVPRGAFITANTGLSVKPYKIVSVSSTLNPFQGNYPYYQIACLDAAKEAKATITVIVRDWNKTFKLQNEIDRAEPIGMRQGICSNLSYTTSAGCTGAGGTWRNYVDFGTCSDGVSTTQAACTGGGKTWTKAQGMCSNATSPTKTACTTANATWFDNLMRPTGGTLLNPTNFFYDWNDDFKGIGSSPNYNACTGNSTDRPTYTAPAASGAVPGMVFPVSTDFQFPENGI